jgi:DNA sulfur modification protein DndE
MLEPPVNSIKLSQTAKDQLTKLKRSTKIEQWNILCRWAFFRSLAEAAPPSVIPIPADSNLELTCHQDGLEITPEILAQQFRLHLHRGIGYLAGDSNLRKIEDLVGLAKIC